jgi:hypothetical protein
MSVICQPRRRADRKKESTPISGVAMRKDTAAAAGTPRRMRV